jgi:hypothetical protein
MPNKPRFNIIPGQKGFVVIRDGEIITPKNWSPVVAGPFSTHEAAKQVHDFLLAMSSRPVRPLEQK